MVLIAGADQCPGAFSHVPVHQIPGGRECGGAVFRKKSAGIPLCFPDWNRVCADHADRNDLGARSVSRGEQRTAGGAAVTFFTLIPMLIGTSVGNVIIKNTPQTDIKYDAYHHVIDVPQENLFLIAGILVLITLIPLYFAAKAYRSGSGPDKTDAAYWSWSVTQPRASCDRKETVWSGRSKRKRRCWTAGARLRRAGYAMRMQFIYNRDRVRSFPLRLKEWDFYQIQKGNMVLQMTIAACVLYVFGFRHVDGSGHRGKSTSPGL